MHKMKIFFARGSADNFDDDHLQTFFNFEVRVTND